MSVDKAYGTMRTLFLRPNPNTNVKTHAVLDVTNSVDFPAELAHCAAAVPGGKLVDAHAEAIAISQILLLARGFEFCLIDSDGDSDQAVIETARCLRRRFPEMMLGLSGMKPKDFPENLFHKVYPHLFDGTLFADLGVEDSFCSRSAVDIYRRDLNIENYHRPHLRHPYLVLMGKRGRLRRSVREIASDVERVLTEFPRVQEIFFDDESLTADPQRAEEISTVFKTARIAWSGRSKPHAEKKTLTLLRDAGLRLLDVDYAPVEESGFPETSRSATQFTSDCLSLGIRIHGRFVLGLPGETRKSIRDKIRFVCDLDVDTIHVDMQSPQNGSELDQEDLLRGLFRMYARFYLRPKKIWRTVKAAWQRPSQRKRRFQIGRRFLRLLWKGPESLIG